MSSTPFAVFRVEKLKSVSEIIGCREHQIRSRVTVNADSKLTHKNVVIVAPPHNDKIMDRIIEKLGGKKPHKNAVLASEILISASPEYFRPDNLDQFGFYEPERLIQWRQKMEPWISEQFPHAISVILHLDEATPHYTIIDIPINSRTGRLSHREKFGGDNKRVGLSLWQTKAAQPVASLGIMRGISGSTASHVHIRQYYENVLTPTIALPKISTPKLKPLPTESLAEKIPFSKANFERTEKEREFENSQLKRNKEIAERQKFLETEFPKLSSKAKAVDFLIKQNKELQKTLVSKDKELEIEKERANSVRAIPLSNILTKIYGAVDSSTGNFQASCRLNAVFMLPFLVPDAPLLELFLPG